MSADTNTVPTKERGGNVGELARRIDALAEVQLDLLIALLARAGRAEREHLLDELDIRRSTESLAGRASSFAALALGVGILVAALLRAEFLARPYLGFGALGLLLLFLGMRGWYRATEVRRRIDFIAATVASDAIGEFEDDLVEVVAHPSRTRRAPGTARRRSRRPGNLQ